MKTRTHRSFTAHLATLAITASITASIAQAASLQVDVNGNGDTTAAGWIGWDPVNPNNSALDTGVGNFAATFATGGTVDLRITTSSNTFERNYGVGAVTGTFSTATPAELWQDQYFHNQAAGAPLTITIDNLQAGPYSFTIYNYHGRLNTAGHAGGGTAITDIFVNGVDSGIDATAYGGNDTAYAAAFLEANVSTVGFTVANDNDTVTLEYRNPTANHFGLNGFALAAAAPDNKPPSLSSTAPLNNALDVPAFSNLVAGFDEAIVLGTSGDITIRNLTDATDVVISLAGPDPDGTLAVTGAQSNQLTIDPAVNLDAGDEYAIQIAAGAIEDTSMNPFGGILDDMTWSFTTAPPDLTAPMSSSMGPVAGAIDVPINSGLTMTFDEVVQAGAGNITIHLASDDSVVATIDVTDRLAVIINGAEVTVVTGNLDFDTPYYINIAAGAFTDLSSNPYDGINDPTTWTFATAANPLQDADLMVDFSRGDEGGIEPLQPGWQGFALLETGGTLETETFASPAAGNDGTVTVSIQGNSHSRDYAPATGTFEPLSALLRDGPLMNAAGTAVLTLEGLRAGLFEITTLHHTTQFGPSERTGTPFDVTLDDANGAGQSISQSRLLGSVITD